MTEKEERPRAVLSDVDFPLIKETILFYINNAPADADEEKKRKLSALYHRLGRV